MVRFHTWIHLCQMTLAIYKVGSSNFPVGRGERRRGIRVGRLGLPVHHDIWLLTMRTVQKDSWCEKQRELASVYVVNSCFISGNGAASEWKCCQQPLPKPSDSLTFDLEWWKARARSSASFDCIINQDHIVPFLLKREIFSYILIMFSLLSTPTSCSLPLL